MTEKACVCVCVCVPVARSSTKLGVVFDLGFSATGSQGGHAPIGEGEGDHWTAAGGENLGGEKWDGEW